MIQTKNFEKFQIKSLPLFRYMDSKIDTDLIEKCVKKLYKILHELDTNADEIIDVILKRTYVERQLVDSKYLETYGNFLDEDISSKLSGNFQKTVLALFKDPYEYDAEWIYDAFKGIANEKILIDALCTKNTFEIKKLNAAFNKLYKQDLNSMFENSVLEGNTLKLLHEISTGRRAENKGYNTEAVKKEVELLYDSGEGKLGTKRSDFIRILSSKSFEELYSIFATYKQTFGHGFDEALKNELSGNFLLACKSIFYSVCNKPLYYALRIKESIEGLGTDDDTLIHILVSRSETDLHLIKKAYEGFYKKTLASDVSSDTSGDYRKIILALIGNNE